jgi:hypothetical protein
MGVRKIYTYTGQHDEYVLSGIRSRDSRVRAAEDLKVTDLVTPVIGANLLQNIQ